MGHEIPQKFLISELTAAGFKVETVENTWPAADGYHPMYCVRLPQAHFLALLSRASKFQLQNRSYPFKYLLWQSMRAVTSGDLLKLRRYLEAIRTSLEELRDAIHEHSRAIKTAFESRAQSPEPAKVSNPPKENRSPGIMVGATVVIAIATAFYTYFGMKQWSAMRGQLEQMQTQNALTRQQLSGTIGALISPRVRIDDIQNTIEFDLDNLRTAPAPIVHLQFRVSVLSFPQGRVLSTPVKYSETITQLSAQGFSVSYPVPSDFGVEDRRIVTQTRTLQVKGSFDYQNGFGTHEPSTSFCYLYVAFFDYNIGPGQSAQGQAGFQPCQLVQAMIPFYEKAKKQAMKARRQD